jgi:hypothetical protein
MGCLALPKHPGKRSVSINNLFHVKMQLKFNSGRQMLWIDPWSLLGRYEAAASLLAISAE